jgi:hypothetical protein
LDKIPENYLDSKGSLEVSVKIKSSFSAYPGPQKIGFFKLLSVKISDLIKEN